MDDVNDNKIVSNEPSANYEFKYNLVNTPWDDRSLKSKVGIVSLLLAIFIATLACVIQNFVMHFARSDSLSTETKCNLIKVDEYKFVARIHSVETQELLCVGAVVSHTSVLASGVCVMSGPIRLRIGSKSEPRCKKGFSVDIIEPLNHDGVISKHMVLLSSYENMAECVPNVIKLGYTVEWRSKAYIIGRPVQGGRSLSRQPVDLKNVESFDLHFTMKDLNLRNMICVLDLRKCPVRAGDLLVQNDRLLGLASTSTHVSDKSKLACFADLRVVQERLKKLIPDIFVNTSF